MNLTRPLTIAGALLAANVAVGLWAYQRLPATARIAIRYHSLDGHLHGTMPKLAGLALFPAVSAVVTGALALAPARSRMLKGLEASADAYGLLITSLAALFLAAEGGLVAQAMDPRFDVFRWVFLAAAILLLLVGNTLGKVRHNDVFGVRTPWTLASARVWDKTHRLTGRLMVAGGFALAVVAGLWPDHRLLVATLVLAVVGPTLAGALYSRAIAERPAQA